MPYVWGMARITKQLEKLSLAPAGTLKFIAKTWVLFVPKSYGEARFLIDGQEFTLEAAAEKLKQNDK